MRQSELFTKTRKENPKDEVSTNAKLLIRAGYIYKEMAGVYAYLPLGLRVLRKIENIIREEMDAIGGQEILLSALQEKTSWEKTDRWDDKVVDIWFKTRLANQTELGLGFTHEEQLTKIMTDYIASYRDLPVYPYQIQNKFRNEVRAKSGIMRGREFLMKDLYSFSRTEQEHEVFYEKAKVAYTNIFSRVGIGDLTYFTFASGGSFSKFSHEYQVISDAGEDEIYVAKDKNIAINKEVYDDDVLKNLGIHKDELEKKKSIEVGNIFGLGTRFSEKLGLHFLTETGEKKSVIMGSYGIGVGRLLGTVVEVLSDEKGIIWPHSIAPYDFHITTIGNSDQVKEEAEKLYNKMKKEKIEVFYDDRDLAPGEKLADADLLGLPHRIVISEKTIKEGKYEIKDRMSGDVSFISLEELLNHALEIA